MIRSSLREIVWFTQAIAGRLFVDDLGDNLGIVGALERSLASRQFVEDNAHAQDVGAMIVVGPIDRL